MENNELRTEIRPPWAEYPGYTPADTFWRQAGEPWLKTVWQPYFDSLNESEQAAYLKRWNVPEVWRRFYFDRDFQEWLESVDEDGP